MRKLGLAMLLCIAVYLALASWPGATGPHVVSAILTIHQDQAGTVTGAPSISASFIDSILCSASSPACGTGQALYNDGLQYGIDPAYALAFFQHESGYGKYGVARVTLGLGNIRCSSGYRCIDGYRAYKSWPEGYADWYQLISTLYIHQLHLTTIEQIVPVYAPPVENDTQGYIAAIQAQVIAWRKAAHS